MQNWHCALPANGPKVSRSKLWLREKPTDIKLIQPIRWTNPRICILAAITHLTSMFKGSPTVNTQPVDVCSLPGVRGLPSASPFCLKLFTGFRIVGMPYDLKVLRGPPTKPRTCKAPYIERADGSVLPDSNLIIDTLSMERQITLDDHLNSTSELQQICSDALWKRACTSWPFGINGTGIGRKSALHCLPTCRESFTSWLRPSSTRRGGGHLDRLYALAPSTVTPQELKLVAYRYPCTEGQIHSVMLA